MNRKRFIKKLMGMGLSRNEARQTAAEMLERNSELMHENRLRRGITERVYAATGVWNVGYRARMFSYAERLQCESSIGCSRKDVGNDSGWNPEEGEGQR
jgi:hypothetical protein